MYSSNTKYYQASNFVEWSQSGVYNNINDVYEGNMYRSTADLLSLANYTDMPSFALEGYGSSNFKDKTGPWRIRQINTNDPDVSDTLKVTVQDVGGQNKYFIDGEDGSQVPIELTRGARYVFDLSDPSVSGHPLRFSETADGTHSGGGEYTAGITISGTPGTDGMLVFTVPLDAPATLYTYCQNHSGMGGRLPLMRPSGSWMPKDSSIKAIPIRPS